MMFITNMGKWLSKIPKIWIEYTLQGSNQPIQLQAVMVKLFSSVLNWVRWNMADWDRRDSFACWSLLLMKRIKLR